MKKGYIKPDAEYIDLLASDKLMNQAGGVGTPDMGSTELPPGFGGDDF